MNTREALEYLRNMYVDGKHVKVITFTSGRELHIDEILPEDAIKLAHLMKDFFKNAKTL